MNHDNDANQPEKRPSGNPYNLVVHFKRPAVVLRAIFVPAIGALAIVVTIFTSLIALIALSGLYFPLTIFQFGLRLGYLSLVYAGLAARLPAKQPALILTEDGIDDQSSPAAGGFIPWSKIVAAHPANVLLHQGIALYLDDPYEPPLYSAGSRRFLQQCNHSIFGTPIHIPTGCLDISKDDLLSRLYKKILEQKQRTIANPPPDGPLRPGTPFAPRSEYLVPYQDAYEE